MNTPSTDRLFRAGILIMTVIAAGTIVAFNLAFYHDDAFITLRYARHFLAGQGLVWNPGEYVQGYTNFLHLLVVAAFGAVGFDLVTASRLVGVVSFLLLIAAMLLYQRSDADAQDETAISHLPVVLVGASCPLLVWSLGGLEGTFFSMLITVGVLCFLRAMKHTGDRRLPLVAGIMFGLGSLVRPDGIVFAVCALTWLASEVLRPQPRAGRRSLAGRRIAMLALGFGVVTLSYVVWQYSYYGDIVPNTFYAKTGTPLWLRWQTGKLYVARFLVAPPFTGLAAIAVVTYGAVKGRLTPTIRYLGLNIGMYILFILYAGGDGMPAFRLFLPVVPLMSIMLQQGVRLVSSLRTPRAGKTIAVVALGCMFLQLADTRMNPGVEDAAAHIGTSVGRYIERAWPAGSLVALHTAGSTPYYAPSHRFIDMLGLNDRVIGHRTVLHVDLPMQRMPGHMKGDGKYVLRRNPDFIILGIAEGSPSTEPWFLSDLELGRDPRFHQRYTEHRVQLDDDGRENPKGALTFTYYVRNRETGASSALLH
jgi:arabinofuranosyltransferase